MSGKLSPYIKALPANSTPETRFGIHPNEWHDTANKMIGEEPRRSGRAGKGVNVKNLEPSPPPAVKPKAGKKTKGKKNTHEPEEQEEEDEEDAIIRCICGSGDEDEGGRMMICCEICETWQHNDCMGVTEDQNELPEKYYCERCRPNKHKVLLAAMARGAKPWEEVARRKEENKRGKKGKKGKGGRHSQSAAQDVTMPKYENSSQTGTPAAEPEPATQEKGKRKQVSEENDGAEKPSKLRKPSAVDKPAAVTPHLGRRTSSSIPQKTSPKPVIKAEGGTVASDLNSLSEPSRKGCANFLKGKFDAQVRSLSMADRFQTPEGLTPTSLSEQLALNVEDAMHKSYIDDAKPDWGGRYKMQMQAIASNIAQNNELMLRLLNRVITPRQLATMSSDDMASEDLQREMAVMKEEADKQSTLITDPTKKPMMRRTHKGDEYIEDQSNQMTSETLNSAAVPRRRDSEFPGPQSPTLDQHMTDDSALPMGADGAHASHANRRSSSNFDIKNVWQSVQSPDSDHPPRFAPPQQDQVPRPDGEKGTEDAEIDRLLADDDNESAPYSPGEYQESGIAWRGNVDMPNVGRFKAFAHHVAGSDLTSRIQSMSAIFPESFTLSGRIHSTKADEYLSSLGAARATDVTVHSIMPADGTSKAEGQAQFDKLFAYFTQRDRWGVVSDGMHREHVTDTYIVPLEAGMSTPPTFLERLDYNIIEQPRPRHMLLAVFVLKWRQQGSAHAVPHDQVNPANAQQNGGQDMTPIGPGASVMSPIATPASNPHPNQQAFQFPSPTQPPSQAPHNHQLPHHAQQQSSHGFPENPYGSTQAFQPTPGQAAAQAILGEYYSTPTVQSILAQESMIPEPLLRSLRRVLESRPETRTDMQAFQRILAEQDLSS